MSKSKVIKSPFQPRPLQTTILQDKSRFSVIVAHRRFGKTVSMINKLILVALECPLKNPVCMYIAPEKAQAKDIAEQYLIEYTSWIPGATYLRSEMAVTFPVPNGSLAKIMLRGADRPDQLRGMYYDHVVFDEVAQMPKEVWFEVILPALADRKGGATFIGTPKGRNILYDLFELGKTQENWSSHIFRASTSGVLPKDELDFLKFTMGEEVYEQEFECSFDSTFRGSFYGKQLLELQSKKFIGEFNHNPSYKVITAWDIGYQDDTVIWFAQKIGDVFYIIDYYSNRGQLIDHYINYVMSRPYIYKNHIVPHDAYKQGMTSELSVVEKMRKAGMNIVRANQMSIIEGINTVRNFLPYCRFNRLPCQAGIDHLASYQAKEDSSVGILDQKPIDGIHSHASDAFRYLAVTSRLKTFDESGWMAKPDLEFNNNKLNVNYVYNIYDS